MSDLRAALLKKRQQQAAAKPVDTEAAGEDPQTAAKYGKLKQSSAQSKQNDRKFFDSADRNTVGLPAAAANGGAPAPVAPSSRKPVAAAAAAAAASPSTLASPNGNPSLAQLTIGAAGGSTAGDAGAAAGAGAGAGGAAGASHATSPPNPTRAPINKHIDKIKGTGATGVDAADTAAGGSDAAPGPGVAVPVSANSVGDDGKELPSAKRLRVGTVKAAAQPGAAAAGTGATATSPGAATGQVHINSGGKAQADILLVEDVRVSQRIAQVALQKARFKVDVASTAEEAIEKFKASPVKIVLMDIQLPRMNGMEATQIIRDWEEATEKARAASGAAPVSVSASAPASAPEAKSTIGFGGADVGNHPRSLIFGLTGAVEEENLRQYRAVGMNGCIAKGKLLATAVKTAIEKISEKPSEFVNLVSM